MFPACSFIVCLQPKKLCGRTEKSGSRRVLCGLQPRGRSLQQFAHSEQTTAPWHPPVRAVHSEVSGLPSFPTRTGLSHSQSNHFKSLPPSPVLLKKVLFPLL